MTETPQPADYQLGYYKQKLAAAEDEASQLYAQLGVMQQKLAAATESEPEK